MRRSRKWILTLAAVLLFLVCGQFLPEEPLRSKAMVVGFGIDLTEENKLQVHLQILTGSGSKTESGSNTRVLSAEGSTLGEAAYKISRNSGLAVSLTHCNVVILGEKLLKSVSVYAVLNYLVTNAYLSDNACLLACEGKAGDILSSPVGFGGNAGIYIREIIGMYDSFGDITGKTLREFVVDYHRLGQTNWLPYIRRIPIEPEIPFSSSQSSSSDKKEYLFEMNRVAVIIKNNFVGIWEEEGTVSINLLLNNISKGQLQTTGENGEKIDWYLLKNKCDLSYDLASKTVTAKVQIEALVKEIIDTSASDLYVDRLTVTEEELARCETTLAQTIAAFFLATKQQNADVFGFREGFYSHYKNKAKDLPLSEIGLSVDVKIKRT